MAAERKARGPKPKPAAKQQTVQVMVRLTEAEATVLDEKRGAQPRGTYIRNAYLNSGARNVPELNIHAYSELSRSASNLNQVMKHINSEGAKKYVTHLQQALKDFRAALIGAKHESDE